ncbi:radical SAM protein [Tissierella praeacuta]|uniref:radical SAM/SPASM domain-containing protein n=1 Tax=Tissierella praeacuta TaxID=43131 RepID=UPI00333FEFAB
MDENNEIYNSVRIKLIEDGLIDYRNNNDLFKHGRQKKNSGLYEKNTIFFKITNNCNLACEFCCASCSNQILDKDMSITDFKLMFNKIKKIKTNRFVITGGEPLMNPNVLDILKYCKENCDNKIILLSNGLLINKNNFEDIANSINFIVLSVENLFDLQNKTLFLSKFKKIIENFKSKLVGVTLSFVITKKNKKNVLDFIDYCNKLNVGISLNVVAPMGKANDNTSLLLNEDEVFMLFMDIYQYIREQRFVSDIIKDSLFPEFYPREACSAGKRILSVDVNGSIDACHSIENDDYNYGNINAEEIGIISDTYNKKFSKLYGLSIDKNMECRDCEYKYFCGGNCYAEILDNENMGKRVMCKFYKKLIPYKLLYFDGRKDFQSNLDEFFNYCKINSIAGS